MLRTPSWMLAWPTQVVIIACAPMAAWAQPQQDNGDNGQDELRARMTANVYLNDSFEASDAIAEARRLSRLGRWGEAATLLQDASDSAGKKLIRLDKGHYVGIRRHVSELVAEWPAPGIRAYQSLFEEEIETAMAKVPDRSVDRLLALFERYFCTSAAAKLADRIAQLAIESGDLALGERVYRRVLNRHPDRDRYRSDYQAKLAILHVIRNGNAAEAPSFDPTTTIRWMGEDRLASDIITSISDTFTGGHDADRANDWPVYGGQANRNRLGATSVDELGLLWRFAGFGVAKTQPESAGFEDTFQAKHDQPKFLTLYPVVSGEYVYVQRYREIVALHRNSGVLAWRFHADSAGSTNFTDLDESPRGWDAVTVHDGRVYAALPGEVVPYYGYETAQSPPELVCLDAATGELIWPAELGRLATQYPEVSFDSTPLLDHDRLYIVGRRRRSFGFEDCYLYRFDATTGRLAFRTHLGSGSTGTFGSRRATQAMAALQGDTVYVSTNLGSIAAVSAHTGTVRWIRLYDRDGNGSRLESSWSLPETKPWAFNAAMWADGKIVCLPTDSPNLLVLAADDGTIERSIPTSEIGGIESMLGVHDGLLCGVGNAVACYDLARDAVRWSKPLPDGSAPYGRGVWADDRLLVPTQKSLISFAIEDGSHVDLDWDADGYGGNVLALPDQLLVTTHETVASYVRKADIWRALRERMAAEPSNPTPALELAEVALRSGETAEALEALDEAVNRAGNFLTPIDSAMARRLFDDVLLFVDVLANRSVLEPEVMDKLYTYASQCAPDKESHLSYRFRFGPLFERFGMPDHALRLYQQVLMDRSLRDMPYHRRTTGSESAGAVAQARVAALIETHGRALYAPYEAQAHRWLDGGITAGDLDRLTRLVATFPNSHAAPSALVAQGDILIEQDEPESAATVYGRAYHRYPKHVNRPQLMRKIADAYEAAGKLEYAYRWLTKAAREHPSVMIEYAGRPVTFLEYRARLAEVHARVEPSRPDIVLPLTKAYTREFEEPVRLLLPRFDDAPILDWSRYYVQDEKGIRAFAARADESLWSGPTAVRTGADLLVATADLAVFATQYEVFALDAATGARRWTVGEYPEAFDDEVRDWEDGEAFRTHALQGTRLVSVRDNGEMTCLGLTTGELQWSKKHLPAAHGRLRFVDPWVVYHATQDGRAVLCLVNASTGEWINAIVTDESRSVEDILVTLGGQLILVTSQSVAAYDPETDARRWRLTLEGTLRPSTLLLDIDALYFSDDGRRLRKINLEDGRTMWESEALVGRGEDDLTVQRQSGSIVLSTTASISAVDQVTGLTLWRGTTPERPRFRHRMLTTAYVVAVDLPEQMRETGSTAYFYDHRNASGLIPKEGGALELGDLSGSDLVLAVDGGLVAQSGSTIRVWAAE